MLQEATRIHESEGGGYKNWSHGSLFGIMSNIITNDDSKRPIFLSHPNTIDGFFFLLTIDFFYIKVSFHKSLVTQDAIALLHEDVTLTKHCCHFTMCASSNT